MKTIQQTPECTTFSVNVNVHIALRFRQDIHSVKRNSESLPLASSFGYFTTDNRTHTTTLVHHHFLHAFGRFLRSGDVMNGRNGSPSSHTSNSCLQSIVTHVETVFCHRSNLRLCRHCLSTRLTCSNTGLQYRQLRQVKAKCPA